MKRIALVVALAVLALACSERGVARAERKAPEVGDKLTAVLRYCSRIGGYFKSKDEGDGVYEATCDTGSYMYTASGGRSSSMRIAAVGRVWQMSVAEVRAERRDLRKAKWVRGPNKCSLSKDCEAYTGTTGTVHSQWQTVIFDGTEKGAVSREDLMMDADAL